MRSRLWLVLVLSACGTPAPRELADAAMSIDASTPAMDGGTTLDAAHDPDAPGSIDVGLDAFSAPDATWGSCDFAGVMGTCESTSLCPAGSMPMSGLCPGPADIQCCLPVVDGGTGAITPSDVLAALGSCTRIGGDYEKDVGETANIPICRTSDVIWWQADMDIDCDGGQGSVCMSDPDYMSDTSGVDSHGDPLDASTLPFIVIPLVSSRFSYSASGIHIGQVALVMYGGRMAFGIFGDAGPAAIIGEASFAMAAALGIPNNPSTGGVDSGVTYLVFTDASARVAHNESNAEAVSIGMPLLQALVH